MKRLWALMPNIIVPVCSGRVLCEASVVKYEHIVFNDIDGRRGFVRVVRGACK